MRKNKIRHQYILREGRKRRKEEKWREAEGMELKRKVRGRAKRERGEEGQCQERAKGEER